MQTAPVITLVNRPQIDIEINRLAQSHGAWPEVQVWLQTVFRDWVVAHWPVDSLCRRINGPVVEWRTGRVQVPEQELPLEIWDWLERGDFLVMSRFPQESDNDLIAVMIGYLNGRAATQQAPLESITVPEAILGGLNSVQSPGPEMRRGPNLHPRY